MLEAPQVIVETKDSGSKCLEICSQRNFKLLRQATDNLLKNLLT